MYEIRRLRFMLLDELRKIAPSDCSDFARDGDVVISTHGSV